MTIDRASVEEGARLAAEAMAEGNYAAYASHVVNPEHYAELARELQRLWRVEDAARAFLTEDEAEAELIAALTNPAAEDV